MQDIPISRKKEEEEEVSVPSNSQRVKKSLGCIRDYMSYANNYYTKALQNEGHK